MVWETLRGEVDMGFKPYTNRKRVKYLKWIFHDNGDVDDLIFGDDYRVHSTK